MIALAATVAVLATPALPGAPHQRAKLAASEVAPYPPMQWHSWGLFTHEDLISEQNMEEMASALISSGMAAAGYSTINVVCNGWIGRDPKTGMLLENRTLWPNGIKGFAASLHARGMKLGCYTGTCSDGRRALRNPCPTSARRSRNMPYMLVVHSHTALTPPRTHAPAHAPAYPPLPLRCCASRTALLHSALGDQLPVRASSVWTWMRDGLPWQRVQRHGVLCREWLRSCDG